MKQVYYVFDYFAGDNSDLLPSAADNQGLYHSVRLSSQTFTNLMAYAGEATNIFYCPNLVFTVGQGIVGSNDAFGYIIGYSYLANDIIPSSKGADYTMVPVPFTMSATNGLLADANYWTASVTEYGPVMKMAPHTASGGAMALSAPPTAAAATNSASLGAMGGNVEYQDGAVVWKTINSMQTHHASSPQSDAYGNW